MDDSNELTFGDFHFKISLLVSYNLRKFFREYNLSLVCIEQ